MKENFNFVSWDFLRFYLTLGFEPLGIVRDDNFSKKNFELRDVTSFFFILLVGFEPLKNFDIF